MKRNYFSAIILGLILVAFTSCDPSGVGGSSNYWNSNSLVRMQLNGKVKTLTTNNGANVANFNQDGFLTQTVYSMDGGTSTTTYNYASTGELTSMDFTSTMSNPATSYSTTYTYQNVGKFIITLPIPVAFHVLETGLVPNLKSMAYSNGGTTTYTFNGDVLTIFTIIGTTNVSRDTTYVTYSGMYPVSMNKNGGYLNMTYASNGMFKTITSGFVNSTSSSSESIYFKADSKYLLKDSLVTVYTNPGYPGSHSATKYSYDSNKNLISETNENGSTTYSYVFDSQGNWTSKTSTYSGSTGTYTETRTITYW